MAVGQKDRSRFTVHSSRLLFIHGWATDSRVWKYQVEEFLKDYEVITVNLPGHGDGDTWSEPTLRPAVEKVLQFTVPGSQFTNLVGIGWSLGAMVLMEIAHIYPDAFQGLVLVGATPRFVMDGTFPWGQARGRVRQMIKDLRKGFYETLERFYPLNFTEEELTSPEARGFIGLYQNHLLPPLIPLSSPFFKGGKKGILEEGLGSRCRAALQREAGGFSMQGVVTALEALSKVDLRGILSEVKVPILLIHGEKDRVSSIEGGRYLARNLPMARLEVFKDTGHAPFLTRHREFNTFVRRFLKQKLD